MSLGINSRRLIKEEPSGELLLLTCAGGLTGAFTTARVGRLTDD